MLLNTLFFTDKAAEALDNLTDDEDEYNEAC